MKNILKQAIFQRIFFGIGCLFLIPITYKVMQTGYRGQQSYSYEESYCAIVKNEWRKTADGPVLELEYMYSAKEGGAALKGTRYQWGLDHFSNQNRSGAKEFVRKSKPGSMERCYFDPKQPEHVVLRPGMAYHWYEGWVILIFCGLFSFGLYTSLFYPEWAEKTFVSSDPS